MASSMISTEKRPPPNLMMLKDYLKDDYFSSCSSNGFKSFPRRQCCTTVRFLLEIDLNTSNKQQHLKTSKSASSSSSISAAFQKAVINAVKLLPFPSSKDSTYISPSKLFLPRSFSRKLFKKSFWRKAADHHKERSGGVDITRWRLFRQFLQETDDKHHSTTSSDNSCSEYECSSNYPESYSKSQNDAIAVSVKDPPIHKNKVSDGVGVTAAKEWANEEDKEQFSPVSVLDCPFQDEEEEISSPFQRRLDRMEGTKQKLKAKIRTFESLAHLEPVNLEKQIKLAGLEDDGSIKSPLQTCSLSIDVQEERAQELFKLVKATIPSKSLICKTESILLDFFREKILENNASSSMVKELKQELQVVQDWINGHPQEMFLGWEVKDSRHVYVKDMEKNAKWRNINEEKEELVLELELEIYMSLVNETLLDLLS